MEIILLGSGTAVPTPGRTPAALLLIRNEIPYLFDIGPGAVHKVAARGFNPTSLQHIFLTHLHSDHTLDLVTFLQMNDSNPGIERTSPVFLTGPHGTKTFYDALMLAFPGISPQAYSLTIREYRAGQLTLDGMKITTALSGHTPVSLCYRVDAPDGSFVYTGDCAAQAVYAVDKALIQFCQGVDVLVSECSFPAGWPPGDHLNVEAASFLADRAKVSRLVLTHLYPPAAQVDLAAQARQVYRGPVDVAVDGFSISLHGRDS